MFEACLCLLLLTLIVISLILRLVKETNAPPRRPLEMTFESSYTNLDAAQKRQFDVAPRYTETGVLGLKMPLHLKKKLREAWNRRTTSNRVNENVYNVLYTETNENAAHYHDLNSIDPAAADMLSQYVKSELMQWTGITDLRLTALYGFRDYKTGAILKMHLDRFRTHALSAIINVHQDGTPWPLIAYDHHRLRHDVYLEDDDVLLYESGTVIHGRPIPFSGGSFVNIFVHFTCSDWEERVAKPLTAEGYES